MLPNATAQDGDQELSLSPALQLKLIGIIYGCE